MSLRFFQDAIYTIRVIAVAILIALTLFLTIRSHAFVYDVEGPCIEHLGGTNVSAENEKALDRDIRPDLSDKDRHEADKSIDKSGIGINNR